MADRPLQPQVLSKQMLPLAVNLLKGHIQTRHDPRPLFSISHLIVPIVIELQINNLIRLLRTIIPQIIELVELMHVPLQLSVPVFWGDEVHIVPTLVIIHPRINHIFTLASSEASPRGNSFL